MRSILITGVQGVGKSTLCHSVSARLGMRTWDYADLMLKADPELPDKDAIAHLGWIRRSAIYAKVDELLEQNFSDGCGECILLENHLSIVDDSGIRTFPLDAISRYGPVGIVVVEADPEEVVHRRSSDTRRNRWVGSRDEVDEQQRINRGETQEIQRRYALPVHHVQNTHPGTATEDLVVWTMRLLG